MRREHRYWVSGNLGQDMELLVYGHSGLPLICFPSHNGRLRDWEAFGMVDAVADLIEAGRLLMISVDGVDWQSWTNKAVPVEQRARRHNDYHRYITDEVVPFVRTHSGRDQAWVTGCSMGG
ncbi:MAG TPA: alpha/beta hydrolase-fold protein, partial [Candidatus Limnocylindrales bacterium]|nr:alpha/beta hydrolase-fold protein [Candidatus Limnocylindrales bacterium]